ncbi:MAG: RIP metalloprotease RseP [Acidobacteriota bacterium]|nr:RIP metalloprotease RseP [Acidobacteriota bacterium]
MIDLLTNTAAFIFALGVIIFVHEAGHLLMGKAFGMRVLAFSLGFGKRIFGFRRGETDYRVSLVPLGGFVSFGGEEPGEESEDPRDFHNKPRWQRILVFLAGPAMNVALAIVLIAFVFMVGVEVSTLPGVPAAVGTVFPDSPAASAGLEPGDKVVAVDGEAVDDWEAVEFAIRTSPEKDVTLTVRRGERELEVVVRPLKVPRYGWGDAGVLPKILPTISDVGAGSPAEAAGFLPGDLVRGVDGRGIASMADLIRYIEERAGQTIAIEILRDDLVRTLDVVPAETDGKGRIGVALSYFQRFPPGEAFVQSLRFNWQITRRTFDVLGKIVTGQMAAKSALSGPIEIARMSGAAARASFVTLLQLMGLISISIAILNLLPIPVLDGGQITVLAIETLRRKDLTHKLKERIQQVGFVLILMLMGLVLYFDVVKSIPAGFFAGS